MIPWVLLDRTKTADGGELTLHQRGDEFSIRIDNQELMNSRRHGSEEALAELTLSEISNKDSAHVLVGGLGMGFTLAAALKEIGPDGKVDVAELFPAVVRWNREHLGHLAGNPLDDPRTSVLEQDVSMVLKNNRDCYNAVLLDVDNGPEGFTGSENDALYSVDGLRMSYNALKKGGALAVWSAGPDKAFTKRLKQVGFKVAERRVRARKSKGGVHTIWIANKMI